MTEHYTPAAEIVMPFGKHCGKALGEVATEEPSYLCWLLDHASNLTPAFREAVRAVLFSYDAYERGYRAGRADAARESSPRSQRIDGDCLADTVRTWHRRAAIELHPDRTGGNARPMAIVNDLRDCLMQFIEGAAP